MNADGVINNMEMKTVITFKNRHIEIMDFEKSVIARAYKFDNIDDILISTPHFEGYVSDIVDNVECFSVSVVLSDFSVFKLENNYIFEYHNPDKENVYKDDSLTVGEQLTDKDAIGLIIERTYDYNDCERRRVTEYVSLPEKIIIECKWENR